MLKNEEEFVFGRYFIVRRFKFIHKLHVGKTVVFYYDFEVVLLPQHRSLAPFRHIGEQLITTVQRVAVPVEKLLLTAVYSLYLLSVVLPLTLQVGYLTLI